MSQSSILLTPDINASVLINQQGENTADFYCHSSVARQIELWTNLSEDKSWIGIPFTRQNETDYSLKVEIINLKPDNYEYTLRFRRGEDDVDWFWYSNIDDNGKIRIVPSSDKTSILLEGHKHFKAITRLHLDNVYLQHFTLYPKSPLSILLEISHNIYSFLVLLRKGSCWVTPVSGYNTFDSRRDHERWQMVMYEDSKDGCVYLWTIASQSSDCWFSPKGGNSISVCHSSERDDDINLLISSTPFKDDFAKLVSTTISYYQQMTNRSNKSVSQSYFKSVLLEKLGYCTWNAFGKEVSLEKIHTAVESLSKHDIPIGYLIIDDGWQAVNSKSQFDSFDACPKKFPGGLKHMVEELKSFYPFLKAVGVWHTLWGYWNGLDEDFANDNGYWWSGFEKKDSSDFIGILSEPSKFYADFYSFLSSSGVDFVKVDNQGAFQDLNADFNAKIQTWDDYRLSMVNNAYRFLKGQIMHCMSFTPHILFNSIFSSNENPSKAIFRNSDDFFPNEKESHTWHIYANIINALWSSQYPVIGDWDMFQSDHPFAEYHASSRALSGGPIYITDVPSYHNPQLIHRLIGETRKHGHAILRFPHAPLPTTNCVFGNPMERQDLISAFNTCQGLNIKHVTDDRYVTVGFWNTSSSLIKIAAVNIRLIYPNSTARQAVAFVTSGPDRGKLMLLTSASPGVDEEAVNCLKTKELIIRVERFGSALVSISSVKSTGDLLIACLGLTDKFVGTNAIKSTKLYSAADREGGLFNVFEANLTHRSKCCTLWIAKKTPETSSKEIALHKVCLDGVNLLPDKGWNWCYKRSLLKVDMTTVPLNSSETDEFLIQVFIKKR